jgi:imidazolonepropionase-like amidohydrolase
VRAFIEIRNRILKQLADAGANVMMGTDSPQMFNVPGFALHREIAVMSEAGMTNQQILESGTVVVGRYVREQLGIDDQFGTVAEGQRADLVLLGSNPLDDLDNLNDRVGVMVRGQWVSRAEIDAGLAALAAKHAGEQE